MPETELHKASRIRDVAAHAGVSSATVSRVLAGKPHVSESVRQRVLTAVAALGYRPNRIARSLRVQRSRFIGLIVSDIQNPFFSQVVRAVEDALQPHGFAVFLCNTDENPARERPYLDLFLDEQVAGVILAPSQPDAGAYRALAAAGIPLVVIDREVAGLAVDTVVSDNLAASRAAVTQLLGRGHLRVGTILSDLSIPTGRARFDGYRQALADAGIAFDPSLAVFGKPVEAEGYRLAGELFALSTPPTALFTGSKLLSLGALRYLFDHRIEVPGDVALAVFDALDWLPNAPEILSVAQPALEIGARAAELLLRRMDEPRRPVERLVLPSAVTWGSS